MQSHSHTRTRTYASTHRIAYPLTHTHALRFTRTHARTHVHVHSCLHYNCRYCTPIGRLMPHIAIIAGNHYPVVRCQCYSKPRNGPTVAISTTEFVVEVYLSGKRLAPFTHIDHDTRHNGTGQMVRNSKWFATANAA